MARPKSQRFKDAKGHSCKVFFHFVLLCFCAFVPLFIATVHGQNMPLDDKARYERSLEAKVDEVLMRLLGPNQAQVVVQASMDFTRTEKVDMTSRIPSGSAPGGTAKEGLFKSDGSSTDNQVFAEYLLPGFPSMVGGTGRPENTSYQRQMLYPSSFITKLVVTVILNKELPDSEGQAVRSVVLEILAMDQKRGDELIIVKTPFAPFWRTIWYTPEAMSLVFKYGILTIMGIVAMVVVAIGFLKLAGAMNTMAKAQQGHQITMDMGKGFGGMPALPGSSTVGGLLDITVGDKMLGEKKEKEKGGGGDYEKVVFNVTPDQAVFLVDMMVSEDPANVALVAAHLPSDTRSEFLRILPPNAASEVISHLARVRFVEPDVVNTIKDEIERRLSGAVGGVQQVIEVLDKVNLRAKKEMLQHLSEKDPDTARLVRNKIFLPEDLGRLSEKDMSVLISNFKIESLACAIWEFPQELKDAIKKQMADKTWQMVEQTMKYGAPSRESSEKAVEELVESALKLMKEGRIANPLTSGAEILAGPEAEKSLPSSAGELALAVPEPPKPEPAEKAEG